MRRSTMGKMGGGAMVVAALLSGAHLLAPEATASFEQTLAHVTTRRDLVVEDARLHTVEPTGWLPLERFRTIPGEDVPFVSEREWRHCARGRTTSGMLPTRIDRVTILPDSIRVNDALALRLEDGHLPEAHREGAEPIEPLIELLDRLAHEQEDVKEALSTRSEGESGTCVLPDGFTGELLLIIDAAVPSSTIRRVLDTAAESRFERAHLLVDAPPGAEAAAVQARQGEETTAQSSAERDGEDGDYSLPLDLADVVNLQRDVQAKLLPLESESRTMLSTSGMVVVPPVDGEAPRTFGAAYQHLAGRGVPVFVTADSILHLLRTAFVTFLVRTEAEVMLPALEAFVPSVLDETLARARDNSASPRIQDAAIRAASYLAVARRLLDPAWAIPADLPEEEILAEVALIQAHEGLERSPTRGMGLPTSPCEVMVGRTVEGERGLCEDYTRYTPRGYYDGSWVGRRSSGEHWRLQRYFQAYTWLSAIPFRADHPGEVLQAAILAEAIRDASLEESTTLESWQRLVEAVTLVAGPSPAVGIEDYLAGLTVVGGVAGLEQPDGLDGFVMQLAAAAEARQSDSSFVPADRPWRTDAADLRLFPRAFPLDARILWQLSGERVGPDLTTRQPRADVLAGFAASNMLQLAADPTRICDEPVKLHFVRQHVCDHQCLDPADEQQRERCRQGTCRLLPSGLDVVAALGSPAARTQLAPHGRYCGFAPRLDALSRGVSGIDPRDVDLATGWLLALRSLVDPRSESRPEWMTTEAWQHRTADTALTSWVLMRHDALTYQQGRAIHIDRDLDRGIAAIIDEPTVEPPPPPPEVFGFVEPVPDLYRETARLVRVMGQRSLQLGAEPCPEWQALAMLLDALAGVADRELEGLPHTPAEVELIASMDERFARISGSMLDRTEKTMVRSRIGFSLSARDLADPVVVTDVFHSHRLGEVLQVASGPLQWMVVAHELPSGEIGAAVGPVYSYTEMAWSAGERLTDDAWRRLVREGEFEPATWAGVYRSATEPPPGWSPLSRDLAVVTVAWTDLGHPAIHGLSEKMVPPNDAAVGVSPLKVCPRLETCATWEFEDLEALEAAIDHLSSTYGFPPDAVVRVTVGGVWDDDLPLVSAVRRGIGNGCLDCEVVAVGPAKGLGLRQGPADVQAVGPAVGRTRFLPGSTLPVVTLDLVEKRDEAKTRTARYGSSVGDLLADGSNLAANLDASLASSDGIRVARRGDDSTLRTAGVQDPRPEGRVELGEPRFEGMALDRPERFIRTLRRKKGQIRACYEMRLRELPDLEGEVAISWTTDPAGDVTSVSVTGEGVEDEELLGCMERRVRRWRFPEGEEVVGVEVTADLAVVEVES